MKAFDELFGELQAGLGETLALNEPGESAEHVLVVLPSYSMGESLLSHYADRIPAFEHRYLLSILLLQRVPSCELVFLSCRAPEPEVVDYYISLVPAHQRADVRRRFRAVEVADESPRSIAAKLLDRPDLIAVLRDSFAGRPAFIEPWNVTRDEVEVALELQAPINGSAPALQFLGFKSEGRRIFRAARVPAPFGSEDVRSVDDVMAAAAGIRAANPRASAVVVKLDNSGAGDGNMIIELGPDPVDAAVRERVEALPGWFLSELRAGGVVEELITGTIFATPSAQGSILPDGSVTVLSTHEQVVGGPSGQVYLGCRFPAEQNYVAELAEHTQAIGERLAERGAVGRFGVDFAAAADEAGRWRIYALEINLRKGGTTHPFAALRNASPGHYDPVAGRWVSADGSQRAYCSTDNLVDAAWLGLSPGSVIKAITDAGLHFDPHTRTGVILHMLSCLAIDGRFGLTAIGSTPEEAATMYEAAEAAVRRSFGGYERGRQH